VSHRELVLGRCIDTVQREKGNAFLPAIRSIQVRNAQTRVCRRGGGPGWQLAVGSLGGRWRHIGFGGGLPPFAPSPSRGFPLPFRE
jgi:hypothetical protein